MADFSNALAVEKEMRKVGYLKRNTINPGETISGYVHVKRVRGEIFRYVVKIEGAEYLFEWNYGKH
ncbi:MAG: membrane-binding protein, partial [Alistipes sp.]|nr:membrane-binding protein [Alistipes sp.]